MDPLDAWWQMVDREFDRYLCFYSRLKRRWLNEQSWPRTTGQVRLRDKGGYGMVLSWYAGRMRFHLWDMTTGLYRCYLLVLSPDS